MAEELVISHGSRQEQYEALLPQLGAILDGERDQIANLGNVAAALKQQFDWLWIGFYLLKEADLVLGPFQGPVACTRIQKGKGVCGTSWAERRTIIVPDVDQFPGHIACSSLSKSEIVVPLFKNDDFFGVLDIDSADLNTFGPTDQYFLEKIATLIKEKL